MPIRLMTLAPGHFHAALVHRDMHPEVHRRVYVYAPLDDDTVGHVARITAFNSRPVRPTSWELDLRAGPDFLARCLREQPGSAVVIAGRNAPKIDWMLAAVRNNCHVLADKPWVIDAGGYAQLPDLLREAELREVVVSDLMTERHEVTAGLVRDLLRRPEIVGTVAPGTRANPAIRLASVHYLKKTVAGRPLRRPAWWFDAAVAGTAVADVGTHLADLAMWLLFPDDGIEPGEVAVTAAEGWPTPLSLAQYQEMTGLDDYPPDLRERWVTRGTLAYPGNGRFDFTVRGVAANATVRWDCQRKAGDAAEGNEIAVRGTNATVTVRSVATLTDADRPEVWVTAADSSRHTVTLEAVRRWCEQRPEADHGMTAEDHGDRIRVVVPDRVVTAHESHFADVFGAFLRRVRDPRLVTFPPENLLAKYRVTTTAAALASR